MNIAFATIYDSNDISRGSGTFYYLSHELEKQGNVLHRLGPVSIEPPLISRVMRRLHRLAGRRYVTLLDPIVGRGISRQIDDSLRSLKYDVLLTNDVSIAAFSRSIKPVVLYTDVMITCDYEERTLPYSRLSNLSPISLWLARSVIKRALHRAQLCVFPAEWSAREAIRYVPTATVEVIPFGANLDDPGTELLQKRGIKQGQPFHLLFIGKDWKRKGGDIAVETTLDLRARGLDAHLHVVGGQGPTNLSDSGGITVHGLLDKANPTHRDLLRHLFTSSDALILPSSSEGFVIAPLEAAAYGMPSLGYRAMGVDTSIHHDRSGVLLPLGAPASEFADTIAHWLECPDEYLRLAQGARQHYEQSVNWPRAAAQLISLINKYVGSRE